MGPGDGVTGPKSKKIRASDQYRSGMVAGFNFKILVETDLKIFKNGVVSPKKCLKYFITRPY